VPAIVARTVEIDDPGALLSLLPGTLSPERVSTWVRRGEGLVGWGRAIEFRTGGAGRFAEAQAWWKSVVERAVVRDDLSLPGTGPVAFGSISFSADSPAGAVLVVPEVLVGHRGSRWWLTTIGVDSHLPCTLIPSASPPPAPPEDVAFADGALSGAQWSAVVARAERMLTAGDLSAVDAALSPLSGPAVLSPPPQAAATSTRPRSTAMIRCHGAWPFLSFKMSPWRRRSAGSAT